MVNVLADNIISPLGTTSEENYLAAKTGKTGIRVYGPTEDGLPEDYAASLMTDHFENLVFRSAMSALQNSAIEIRKDRTVFILSTTKGDIEDLETKSNDEKCLGDTAQRIALKLGINTPPIVVCNACISGLSAIILGTRLLEAGKYDYAVVCGCDCPGRFVISGFQSLKALSAESCRPFDIERLGLNLGEAAATVVLGKDVAESSFKQPSKQFLWQIKRGFVRNDAFHISTPSKKGEGLCQALTDTIEGENISDLAFVNAHGTATMFNDQMESVAIESAGLSEVPVNALKGYFGHTLGAAGVLETILSMRAVEDHTVIGTLGYEELGVSGKINISATCRPTEKKSFVKMLSGFGGCNAAIWVEQVSTNVHSKENVYDVPPVVRKHCVQITPKGATINGQRICTDGKQDNDNILTYLYKQRIGDYPKFYKMDGISRLGFVASELLLQAENAERFQACDNRAVVLFNRTSSISADRRYLETISDADNYFPSPSLFVYTLPNIVTGEIAIRNHYHGETSFYILVSRDDAIIRNVLDTVFMDGKTESVLTGWIDYENETHFEAELCILEKK